MQKLPLKLSYTKLSFYVTCPYKYYLRYEKKLPYYPDISTKYGGNVHRIIKDFSHILKAGKSISKQEQQNLIEKQWRKVSFDINEDKKLKEIGIKQLELFVDENFEAISSKTLFFEQSFKYQISEDVILNGYIDRVDILKDNDVEIIDYKSGNERTVEKDNLQLNFYALVCRDRFGLNPVKLSLYFTSTNNKNSVMPYSNNIDDTKELVLKVAEKIMNAEFMPNEKSFEHCPVCVYNKRCKYAGI